MNRELFQKIHEQITAHPETHYQGFWEGSDVCGTARCIAGWAVHLATGAPVYERDADTLSPETRALAESVLPEYMLPTVPAVARRLLGLDWEEAGRLFYADEETAAEAVRLAAEGREGGVRFADDGPPADGLLRDRLMDTPIPGQRVAFAYEHQYRVLDVEAVRETKDGNMIMTGVDPDKGEYRSFRLDRVQRGKVRVVRGNRA